MAESSIVMAAGRTLLAAPTLASVALVDLMNVGPSPRAKTDRDFEDLMKLIGDLVRRAVVAPAAGGVHEVDCRLYGGFLFADGSPTPQYIGAQRQLPVLEGLENRVRLRATLVRRMAAYQYAELKGTYRDEKQKMVDQMLGYDVFHFARTESYDSILVVGNDEDYLPSVLVAAQTTRVPIRWLRKKLAGPNDRLLSSGSVSLLQDGAWS